MPFLTVRVAAALLHDTDERASRRPYHVPDSGHKTHYAGRSLAPLLWVARSTCGPVGVAPALSAGGVRSPALCR